MKKAWVYILECADASFYTGCTTDVERRVIQHNKGIGSSYTLTRRPVRLLWSLKLGSLRGAMSAERRIKRWSRAKKERLVLGDRELVKEIRKQPN